MREPDRICQLRIVLRRRRKFHALFCPLDRLMTGLCQLNVIVSSRQSRREERLMQKGEDNEHF